MKDKPHVWSYTSLACFNTCPKQFYHRYVVKDATFEESVASKRGNAVHLAFEARLKSKTSFPEDMPYERFAAALDERPLLVEEKLGVRKDGDWALWWDAYIYGRGKPDVVVMPDEGKEHAVILDWKTGRVREDPAELETFAVLIHARYPLITKFTGYYVWLTGSAQNTECAPLGGYIGSKYNLDWSKRWKTIQNTVAVIHRAGTSPENFPPKPSGLCKAWCNAMKCVHNGRGTSSHPPFPPGQE